MTEEQAQKFAPPNDWGTMVSKVVNLARANLLEPAQVRDFALDSWARLSEALGEPVPGHYQRMCQELEAIYRDWVVTAKLGEAKARDFLESAWNDHLHDAITWSTWGRIGELKLAAKYQDSFGRLHELAQNFKNTAEFQNDCRQMIEAVFQCAAATMEGYDQLKRRLGLVDFQDQEAGVLRLARDSEAFRASVRQRFKLVTVDEFQDTSPIQLALFLELHRLVGASIWVGDPKQAIYGFRGTDPQLMAAAIDVVGARETLGRSWRSKEVLVDFSNRLFGRVFHELGAENVCLSIPEARKEEAAGGELGLWFSEQGETNIAQGVLELLQAHPEYKPADLAVLCRNNNEIEKVVQGLNEVGLEASAGQLGLLKQQESLVAMAALRYLANDEDSLALVELVQLAGLVDAASWLPELIADPKASKVRWGDLPQIKRLLEGRGSSTPLEALEHAFQCLELRRLFPKWGLPQQRLANLDELRGLAAAYQQACEARRTPTSIHGLLQHLAEAKEREMDLQAKGQGEGAVRVLTYHGAKGLEWPVVILHSLNHSRDEGPFGVYIRPAQVFNPDAPLAGRSIHFWPKPYVAKSILNCFRDHMGGTVAAKEKLEAELNEARRLLYVGVTRAREKLILNVEVGSKKGTKGTAAGAAATRWLDELRDADGVPVVKVEPGAEGGLFLGGEPLPVSIKRYPKADGVVSAQSCPGVWDLPSAEPQVFPPARLAPSSLGAPGLQAEARLLETLGPRLPLVPGATMDRVGDAIHRYLGAVCAGRPDSQGNAQALLVRWGVSGQVSSETLVEASARLDRFLTVRYPGSRRLSEWPLVFRNELGQVISGWVDLLLETPDGYIVIDHKSYPGPDPVEHAKTYAAQLQAYTTGLKQATGRPVLATLIHYPIQGLVVEVLSETRST
jgi:ATP-dependent exoDNAse (exonuclease V) beta subunit